jgi:hypothetical protein
MAKTRIKRPRDPFQLAKQIGDIATGEAHEQPRPQERPKGRTAESRAAL